jgi:hypothetical protein
MARSDVLPARRLDPEALAQDRDQRPCLHLADSGQVEKALLEVVAVARLVPDAGGVAFVVHCDGGTELLRPHRHRPGEAMKRGPLPECAVELTRVHARDRACVEIADPPLQLERSREGLLHGHLLVEDKTDEERQRAARRGVRRLRRCR